MINSFTGGYRWLSNFYWQRVTLDGLVYPTVEHAYQAAKTLDPAQRATVWHCETPGQAKRAGRKVTMRADWDAVKIEVMRGLVTQKFEDRWLREKLRATGTQQIVEGNNWGDTFWGVCRGEGENHLGKILMAVRDALRTNSIAP